MATLSFLMVVMILGAAIRLTESLCGDRFDTCKGLIKTTGSNDEICRSFYASFDCVNNMVNNDATCTDDIKNTINREMQNLRGVLKDKGCSGSSGLVASLLLCLCLSGVTYFLKALN